MSWCPSWSNSLWQGWSCGVVHFPSGNATDPIWRVLASSDGISCWTSFLTESLLSWISYATQKLMLDSCKMVEKEVWSIPYVSVAFFPSLKQNFITYRSSKVSDCIFEIHQLWQSGFSKVYSNCCCSCSFEPEIIKIGQMYSNNIVNFQ